MKKIYNADDFCRLLYHLARSVPSLYVYGAFGQKGTEKNKEYFIKKHFAYYNGKADRAKKIKAATERTFFADCVNLIKAVLWGLTLDKPAVYCSNGVPDCNANTFFNQYCTEISTDFSHLRKGEAVWKDGHIGVYIGQGCAVECTPIWDDGIQITGVANMKVKRGFKVSHNREWEKHGLIPWIDYPKDMQPLYDDTKSYVKKQLENGFTEKEIIEAVNHEF